MDDDLYDEFGNYLGIGDEADSDAESYHGDVNGEIEPEMSNNGRDDHLDDDISMMQEEQEDIEDVENYAVVLHEDKQYYPDASQVYGETVEVLLQEQDTQSLAEPIIKPIDTKRFILEDQGEDIPRVYYSNEYMTDLMAYPELIRNIALAGHLHHGKTAFLDMLVLETHDVKPKVGRQLERQLRYVDTHVLEMERGISIKASPMSLVLESSRGKSHLINIIDTPGHVNFIDEFAAATRLVDGICLVVDVIEGLMINTELVIKHALTNQIPMTLILNKIDRLILELKLPPQDAYYKIKHVLDQVNGFIYQTSASVFTGQDEEIPRLSPERGNVIFASASTEWCFSLNSFARMYAEQQTQTAMDVDAFATRLWGDVFYTPGSTKFSRKSLNSSSKRTFVHFILEPLYKLYAYTLGEDQVSLKKVLRSLNIELKPAVYKLDVRPLLKVVTKAFFGTSAAFVDTLLKHVPSPVENASTKLKTTYMGPIDESDDAVRGMLQCNNNNNNNNNNNVPTVVQIAKLFNTAKCDGFYAFGRIMSGSLSLGQTVNVLGESYREDDQEDMMTCKVQSLFISQSRYKLAVNEVPAGNWALIGGIDSNIVKSATVFSAESFEGNMHIFKPINYISEPVYKVAVEPFNPSELPKMLDGLRKVSKSYLSLVSKVEESGEHIIIGSGELYMDSVLHDLRRLYTQMEIKVSDPVTRFGETCVEQSAIKCYAETPNKRNKITIISEPLEDGIANDIESGRINIHWPVKTMGKFFQENYDWDLLASRSIWAFGPDDMGPNILQDDTLSTEVDKRVLSSVRESLRQGFQWTVREGPLCEEPIRNTKFKITDMVLSDSPIFRGGGQMIPTMRRACYSSFLMSSPRLMEPVYACHITTQADHVDKVYKVLAKRRGHVISDEPISGTPLYLIKGLIPVMDANGFETDIRIVCSGQAMCSLVFDKWQIVPGDPLDKNIKIIPLEASRPDALARDFVLKTRRRKGLSDDPSIAKYLDESLIDSLREAGLLD